MREAFEKWWKLHYPQSAFFIRHNRSGDYMNPHVRTGWKVWQAALESEHDNH
jgi:hypothetical protein